MLQQTDYRGNMNSLAGTIMSVVLYDCLSVRTLDYNLTRKSAIADKPHDAFAQ